MWVTCSCRSLPGSGNAMVVGFSCHDPSGSAQRVLFCATGAGASLAVASGNQQCRLERGAGDLQWLRFPPGEQPLTVELQLDGGPIDAPPGASQAIEPPSADAQDPSPSALDLRSLLEPGPLLWPEVLETQGVVSKGLEPYVVNTLTLPWDNPWKALLFVGGHDFFSTPGKAAICTLHGDVWLVDGVDDSLERLRWRRFATGLFQPLGLKIVDDAIYVLGRDQITRLVDVNNDGQADTYVAFNHDADTSPGGHDYSTCLETDSAGNFYYVSQRGVHRISADGSRYQTIATGLRNPNGMSVGPGDIITAAPQEGEWTPASAVFEVRPGNHFGYGGPQVTPAQPLGYDPPVCWLPRRLDNSTGGQVWVTSDRWGPLKGQLLNLSFGQCRLMLVLREQVNGVTQGGSLAIPLIFEAGVMRGRFNPHDGQLYVSGLRGWVSAAVRDGCLQRVRYTGAPVDMPIRVQTLANGMALTFTSPLDRQWAEDPGNYALEAWNYKYGAHYGSDEFRPSRPDEVGRDEVEVISATLLDQHTVFLQLAHVEPVMQLAIRYALRSSEGRTFDDIYYHTIHRVRTDAIPSDRLTPPPARAARASDLAQRLRPGFLWRFHQPDETGQGIRQDVRQQRLIALQVPVGRRASAFLQPGWFAGQGEGYLRVPLNGAYTFRLGGQGVARVIINDELVIAGSGDLQQLPRRTALLHKGLNQVEIAYEPIEGQDAHLQLYWEHESFPSEPPPPTVVFHAADDAMALDAHKLREGRRLYAEARCGRCHEPAESALPAAELPADQQLDWMPELLQDAPRLTAGALGQHAPPGWPPGWRIPPACVALPKCPLSCQGRRSSDAKKRRTWRPGSGRRPRDPAEPPPDADTAAVLAQQGAALADALGCIVCHRFTPAGEPDPLNRLSLAVTAHKFQRGELARFLRHPQADHPWRKMPDFALDDAQAEALAQWIQHRGTGALPAGPKRRRVIRSGARLLFGERGCQQCHALTGAIAAPPPGRSSPRRPS